MVKKYLQNMLPNQPTPQSQPILGANQVPNSAGGYSWAIGQWEGLRRFLILGSEGGSYYANEYMLTLENTKNLQACIQADGLRTVREIIAISTEGRAARPDTAIFALAMATALGDDATRQEALKVMPDVCRTGTHLFSFVETVQTLRGWGRGLRRSVANWYNAKTARDVAYQVVKYRQRGGWTHRDTLRKAHPIAVTETHDALFKWLTHPEQATWAADETVPNDEALAYIHAFERVQRAKTADEVIKLIADYRLTREALPTDWLREISVWDALLQDMPMTAMIRNLGVMSKVGLLVAGSNASQMVTKRLTDGEALRKARVHPISILSAMRVYRLGYSLKGGFVRHDAEQEWQPVATVLDALDTAFELAFKTIQPTNKSTMLALDVSASMSGGMIAGIPALTPREGSGAMALVTARTEPNYMFTAFSHTMIPLNISAKMRLDTVIEAISNIPFGGTDCALPMIYALENKLSVETFVIYTDSETWFGKIHPAQALREYREKMGIPARLIVVGMVGNKFTIADPTDSGMLDVVGFDSAAPELMADFARGTF
ncbi:MAG: TROVE domain-containing protein [bacterium]|nr:TROVE domain-containing protein [bacterium]